MGHSETWATPKKKHMGFHVRHQTRHDNSGSQTSCETTKWLRIMCTMRETTLTMVYHEQISPIAHHSQRTPSGTLT